jgi:hypothetical protein
MHGCTPRQPWSAERAAKGAGFKIFDSISMPFYDASKEKNRFKKIPLQFAHTTQTHRFVNPPHRTRLLLNFTRSARELTDNNTRNSRKEEHL